MDFGFRNLCIAFAAGAAGGLANSLAVWLAGRIGLTGLLGVAIAPDWTPAWLYPRIVWGGLWGFLLFFPLPPERPWLRGGVLGLAPTLVQLLIVFPFRAGKGFLGLDLGTLTPALIFVFNGIWGWVTVAVAERAQSGPPASGEIS
jgi:hypothetical protein